MPWVPIKNFDEDVRVGDLIKTKSGLRACVESLKDGEVVLRKVTAFNESLDSVWREPKRWRAEYLHRYWSLNKCGVPCDEMESLSNLDKKSFNFGNYFRTYEQAEKAAQKIKDLLTKFHEEEE